MKYFRVKSIASMQHKLKSEMKQCNAVVRENRQHYRNQLNICREPQHSKWNDSTKQWNREQQHKKGLLSEELEIQVPFADFQIVQRKQGRVSYTPHAQIICKAILKLFCLKLKPISFDLTVLLLCFIYASVQDTFGTCIGEMAEHRHTCNCKQIQWPAFATVLFYTNPEFFYVKILALKSL